MAAAAEADTRSLANIPADFSIEYLPNFKSIGERITRKALNLYTQGYIHKIDIYNEKLPKINVRAKSWRSMRKSEKTHDVHIEIDGPRRLISDAYCTCKVGLTGQCSHVLGLIKSLQGFKLHEYKEIPDQLSCTSIPQQWNVPRGKKIAATPINHIVVAKPSLTRKRKPVLCQVDANIKLPKVTTEDIVQLQQAKDTPIHYIVSPDRPTVDSPFGKVQLGSILSYQARNLRKIESVNISPTSSCGDLNVINQAPVKLPLQYEHLKSEYYEENPRLLEQSTKSQALSEHWVQARKYRITSSVFGDIVNRKSKPSEKMLQRLFSVNEVNAPSLTYGKRNESRVKGLYLAQCPNRHIHECGFIINNEFPFLGATPDGKLCDQGQTGLIEIKCPYSARDLSVQQACDLPNFFLENIDKEIKLKKTHSYYMQLQGQLMVSGCAFCDFVVYCPKDAELFIQRIYPDKPFMMKMLEALSEFFYLHADPFIKKMKLQSNNAVIVE